MKTPNNCPSCNVPLTYDANLGIKYCPYPDRFYHFKYYEPDSIRMFYNYKDKTIFIAIDLNYNSTKLYTVNAEALEYTPIITINSVLHVDDVISKLPTIINFL